MPFDQSPEIDLRPFKRTTEQRENLLKLADAVLANERFAQDMHAHPCGAPACILGTAIAARIVRPRCEGSLFNIAEKIHGEAVYKGIGVSELGLTDRQAAALFYYSAPWQTAPAAAAELRRLADERVEP